jgi:ubiquinol-cytochrome c reductase cytochrome b subunit
MQTTPEQPPAGAWETRTGWTRLKQLLFLEPLPGGSRWAAAFGSLLLFTFVLQVVTGVLLSMNYAASTESAWPSVKYIQEEVPLGAFIRAAHHWGSSAMVVLLLVHLVQVFVWGAYKKPRELTWMVGVLLLFCTLGLAFTGYLLPWDQKAYWATKVGLGIVGTVPGIGDGLRDLLQGGPQLGNLTLTRFFTLHTFVLPGLVLLLVAVHLYLFRLHGVTPPWWESPAQLKAGEEPFWPKQALKDGVLAGAFLLGLGLWAHFRPAPLEAQADPSQPYEARPEWYFMFLFQLLRYFHGPYEVVGTFVLPALFFLVLFFWPVLDRGRHRDPRRRPVAIGLLGMGTAGLVGLTVYAVATDVRMKEPAQAAALAPAPVEPAGPVQRADVARLYNETCAACHGVDGSGRQIRSAIPTIPDFTSLAWQMSQTELEITHRIRDGNEPLMPAYRDKLSQPQVLALTVYVRAFSVVPVGSAAPAPAQPAAPPDASRMSAGLVYRAYCLACHDADGRGQTFRKAMPEIPDFTDHRWQASRTDAEFKRSILEGKGEAAPELGASTACLLAAPLGQGPLLASAALVPGRPRGRFMLPMKDKLSEADAERLVQYVRSFQEGKPPDSVEPPRPVVPPPTGPVVVEKGPPAAEPADTADRIRAATGLYRQYCLTCHGTDGRGSDFRAAMPTLPDFASRKWQESVANPQLTVSILDGKGTLMPAFRGRVTADQAGDLSAYVRAFGPTKTTTPTVPADEFEKRYRDLQDQWNDLQKQLKDLSKPPPKP